MITAWPIYLVLTLQNLGEALPLVEKLRKLRAKGEFDHVY